MLIHTVWIPRALNYQISWSDDRSTPERKTEMSTFNLILVSGLYFFNDLFLRWNNLFIHSNYINCVYNFVLQGKREIWLKCMLFVFFFSINHRMYSPLPTGGAADPSNTPSLPLNCLALLRASRNKESVSRTSSKMISVRPCICESIEAGVRS